MNKSDFYLNTESRGDWSFAQLTRAETAELTHCYHNYPAKFIPQLAKELIETYTVIDNVVWDPFCGSGTLNVEAYRSKRNSIGTDINPVSVLISRAKTRTLIPDKLRDYIEQLTQDIDSSKIYDQVYYETKGILNGNLETLKEWFSDDNLLALSHILWRIREKQSRREFKGFALCAFSSILKGASYWLTSSVKSQKDPDKKPQKPFLAFVKQLELMEKANGLLFTESEGNRSKTVIVRHDAKHQLPSRVGRADCIITSPPYLVSYDYSDIFRLSSYLLFPEKQYDKFRRKFIGTPLKRNRSSGNLIPSILGATIQAITDSAIQRTVTEYYRDMNMFFRKARRSLGNNKHMIMVVGDTKLRGVDIPNAYFLYEIAEVNKWHLENSYRRKIPVKILPTLRDAVTGRFTNSSNDNSDARYDEEYILVFRSINL